MPHKAELFKKLCKINYQKQKNKGIKSYLTLKITPPPIFKILIINELLNC